MRGGDKGRRKKKPRPLRTKRDGVRRMKTYPWFVDETIVSQNGLVSNGGRLTK